MRRHDVTVYCDITLCRDVMLRRDAMKIVIEISIHTAQLVNF